MSDNDLHAEISTRIGNTVAELQRVTTGVKQMTSATSEHNKVAAQTHDLHGQIAGKFRETHQHAEKLSHQLAEGAKGLRLFGGQLGYLARHLGHVAHASGEVGEIFGKIGVAAGIAGIAFEVFDQAIERQVDKLKEAIEAQNKYREAVESARDASDKAALSAGNASEARTHLKAIGGDEALEEAEKIANQLGVPVADVQKGLSDSYKLPGDQRETGVQAATKVASSGIASFSEAMSAFISDVGARFSANSGNAANTIYNKLITGRNYGPAAGIGLDDAIAGHAADPVARQIADDNRRKNLAEGLNLGHFANGAGSLESHEELARANGAGLAMELGSANIKRDQDLEGKKQLAGKPGWKDYIGNALGIYTGDVLGWGAQVRYRDALNGEGSSPMDGTTREGAAQLKQYRDQKEEEVRQYREGYWGAIQYARAHGIGLNTMGGTEEYARGAWQSFVPGKSRVLGPPIRYSAPTAGAGE